MIEAGTYLCYGALLGGKVFVDGFKDLELESFIRPYVAAGMKIKERGNAICLYGSADKDISVVTSPHPGYPTDLQPQAAPVMAANRGGTIVELVWKDRFSYLKSLAQFGVSFEINGSNAAILSSNIKNAKSYASDLRGGAAAVACALLAAGESEIKNAEHILRGYSDIEGKLKMLGAYIKIEE
jgi:UDP-N-acetylglucosamine 1-carboxyvinyltransferase